ncbi:MAG TPA: ANTAR domain-containing protein [Nocardioides sp.]|nr:ANTAR domain-containing protein [Nocardioides sp.]
MTDQPSAGGPLSPVDLLRMLTEAVQQIHAAKSLYAAAGSLAQNAVRHLGADAAGVLLYPRSGARQRLAATDDLLLFLDRRDEGVAASPRANELAPGELLLVRDTETDETWPQWSAAVHSRGLRSAMFAGLPPVRGRAVTVELYARRADGFARIGPVMAAQLATHVGLALQHADRRANLEDALYSRGIIGQAQGIIMERYKLTSEQAMAYLRRSSQESHEPVRSLAADIVRDRDPDPPS